MKKIWKRLLKIAIIVALVLLCLSPFYRIDRCDYCEEIHICTPETEYGQTFMACLVCKNNGK